MLVQTPMHLHKQQVNPRTILGGNFQLPPEEQERYCACHPKSTNVLRRVSRIAKLAALELRSKHDVCVCVIDQNRTVRLATRSCLHSFLRLLYGCKLRRYNCFELDQNPSLHVATITFCCKPSSLPASYRGGRLALSSPCHETTASRGWLQSPCILAGVVSSLNGLKW